MECPYVMTLLLSTVVPKGLCPKSALPLLSSCTIPFHSPVMLCGSTGAPHLPSAGWYSSRTNPVTDCRRRMAWGRMPKLMFLVLSSDSSM